MWRAGLDDVEVEYNSDDDWETDADFENDVSEKQQRWGSRTVEGSGRVGVIQGGLDALRHEVEEGDKQGKGPRENFAHGYGGKFGVQTDRQDKSVVGFEYQAEKNLHSSQTDGKRGFGGKFGVDESAQPTTVAQNDEEESVGAKYEKPAVVGGNASSLRSRFESMNQQKDQEAAAEVARQRAAQDAEQRREEEQHTTASTATTTTTKDASATKGDDAEEDEWAADNQDDEDFDEDEHQAPVQQQQQEEETAEAEEAAEGDGLRARALYDYEATGDDEISFDPDDIIEDIERVDEGWWMGTFRNQRGLFPANYVELI